MTGGENFVGKRNQFILYALREIDRQTDRHTHTVGQRDPLTSVSLIDVPIDTLHLSSDAFHVLEKPDVIH